MPKSLFKERSVRNQSLAIVGSFFHWVVIVCLCFVNSFWQMFFLEGWQGKKSCAHLVRPLWYGSCRCLGGAPAGGQRPRRELGGRTPLGLAGLGKRRGAAVPTRSSAFPPQSPPGARAAGCSKVFSFCLKTKSGGNVFSSLHRSPRSGRC